MLRSHETVNPDQTAAIGYCFGGGVVLHTARTGADLDGVVSFHGSLATDTPAKPDTVKARVLVLHGADDPFITPEQVEQFKQEMQSAGVDYRFIAYPGVKHSFTNPEADSYGEKFNLPYKTGMESPGGRGLTAPWQQGLHPARAIQVPPPLYQVVGSYLPGQDNRESKELYLMRRSVVLIYFPTSRELQIRTNAPGFLF